MYELTCTAYPSSFTPQHNSDLNGLLASLEAPRYDLMRSSSTAMKLQCVPRRSSDIGSGHSTVYHVPEDMPIDMVLRQFGVDLNSINASAPPISHYQPLAPLSIQRLPTSTPGRRYLVCQEVTDMGGGDFHRSSPNLDYEINRSPSWNPSPQSPPSVHNILGQAWNRLSQSGDRPGSPNYNSSWQDSPRETRGTVDRVWQRARMASDYPSDYPSPTFNRMGHPPNNYPPTMPPSPQSPFSMQDPMLGRITPPNMNTMRPPMDSPWSRPDFLRAPPGPLSNLPRGGSGTLPPPPTLGTLLAQAYRSRIPPARLP